MSDLPRRRFFGEFAAAATPALLFPTLPWCITLDNSKGISRLRFWGKNRSVNGINDLPVFMHQGSTATRSNCSRHRPRPRGRRH